MYVPLKIDILNILALIVMPNGVGSERADIENQAAIRADIKDDFDKQKITRYIVASYNIKNRP